MQIFRKSPLSASLDEAAATSRAIAEYEKQLVESYEMMDLYRLKGKSRAQISFNDLSLEENLRYIKYDLGNTHEAFKLFKITRDGPLNEQPEIAAALLQKMALSQIKPKQFDDMFGRIEYKQMIRSVKDGLSSLSDKYLVDTVFALGKLHKE